MANTVYRSINSDGYECWHVDGFLKAGASGSEVSYTAGSPRVALYFTNAGTSGSTSAEPFYVYSAITGAGQVGGRGRFHTYTNVTCGGWLNAFKTYMEFGVSGKVTGLASSLCVEMKMPNANMGSAGCYYPLEIEYVAGGTSLVTAGSAGTQAGLIYMNASGDADGDFDDNGYFFRLDGVTVGDGHLFQVSAAEVNYGHSLKVLIAGTVYYLMLADSDA